MIVLSWLLIAVTALAETTDESERSNHVQMAGKIDILVTRARKNRHRNRLAQPIFPLETAP